MKANLRELFAIQHLRPQHGLLNFGAVLVRHVFVLNLHHPGVDRQFHHGRLFTETAGFDGRDDLVLMAEGRKQSALENMDPHHRFLSVDLHRMGLRAGWNKHAQHDRDIRPFQFHCRSSPLHNRMIMIASS